MASKTMAPHQSTGDAMVENGGIKQKNVAVQAKNRRVLNDIGNLVTIRDVESKLPRPITRSFGAKLLANAQVAVDNKNKVVARAGGARVAAKAAAVPKPPTKKVVTAKLEPEIIVISPDTEEVKHKEVVKAVQNEKSIVKKNKKPPSMTAVLTARSKAACGLTNKPKDLVVDIDASDVDNELAVVEYIDDLYVFYKLAENECRPHDYMASQPEINEKMRAILVDWLIEVHDRFNLFPETLYLTINLVDRFLSLKAVPRRELQLLGIGCMLISCKYEEIWAPEVNDFVGISEGAYSHEQILKMEKTILGKLEWYLTVPTPYVFLTRYIKASIPDNEIQNMVYFLAELALMNYNSISFCSSMIAASAVYVARLTLQKSPAWTETLGRYTGFSESQLLDCAKMLATLHSGAPGHKLQNVYKKYSKAEKFAVALTSPARSLLPSSS
ncbi:G2/mitotic-specific cyclin S13-7-like [Silene latifolia]|uniref:G2/mitotic-specific cyclin S13-7-like n=1 Tax=Silene latifolia TaxID=37657 RepID=UPI003D779307